MISLFIIVLLSSSALAWLQIRVARHTKSISGSGGLPVILEFISLGIFGWAIAEIEQRSIISVLLLIKAYLFGFGVAGLIEFQNKGRKSIIE